ncbi:MAG: ABC transporter ATP-binding protein [Pseudomonadota bacterium]
MADISYQNVAKRFGQTEVIRDLSLSVSDGEFVAYVGPSGCGKTTLLRLLAGLEQVSSGSIRIGGKDVTALSPKERNVAMVFQNYALYPHMSVAENIGFGLRMRGQSRGERDAAVSRAAEMLELSALLDRKPRELSGGQRQRVAMGRAIVRDPAVFLMDEPLSNLDAQLRNQMRSEIRALQRRLASTMVYVTHDQIEAMTMADRIVVLRGGEIQQIGTPDDLFDRPANRFVAGFIGAPQMNLLPVTAGVLPGGAVLPEGWQAAEIGIRPQHLMVVNGAGEPPVAWSARVEMVEPLGGETLLHLSAGDQSVRLRQPGRSRVDIGETLRVGFDPKEAHRFDASGQVVA